MKKRYYFTLIAVPILLTLSGCNNSVNQAEDSTFETEGLSVAEAYTEESETISESEEITLSTEETIKKIQTDYKPEPWETAYADYIDSMWEGEEPDPYFNFSLIYLDNDDIPELFIKTSSEAGGEIVLTYYDNEIKEQHLSRIGSTYIERSGLIYTNTGHQGVYPVEIKSLENGEFSVIGSGEKMFRSSMESGALYELDEEGNPISDYTWEGETVTEEEFNSKIDEIFDREQEIRPERVYSAVEIVSKLRTGACTSEGHRYELIQEDVVSWKKAQRLCKEKGGYLATITSPDEQDKIAEQIEEENKTDVSFYVGYRWNEWVDEEHYSSRWINSDGSFTEYGFPHGLWSYDAPDYETGKYEWDMDYWDCGLIKYYESTNKIYLFYAPEKLLDVSPEYSGKMGYICEYDE